MLGPTSRIPVGGGWVFEAERVIVVQPSAGQFVAYSAVGTHAACILSVLDADLLRCPCHATVFSTVDGSVVSGPAPRPLPSREIEVTGDEIRLIP